VKLPDVADRVPRPVGRCYGLAVSISSTRSRPSRARPGFDPEKQPVVPVQPLLPLTAQTLQLDFIRCAFDQPLTWQVDPLFADELDVGDPALRSMTRAAVFMPLVQRADGLHVLFTRRTAHLTHHAGQISFPGGRIEAQDADAVAAALRETHEETGIAPQFAHVLGTQPSLRTVTQFVVTPVVGVLREGFRIQANRNEVAEVFEVPLSVLMHPASYQLHRVDLPDSRHRLYFSISWRSYFIWGATAALLRNFYRFLLAAQNRSG